MGDLPVWLSALALMLGPTGAAWVGVRTALNGTRERVQRIEQAVDTLAHDVADVRERVSRIEGGLGL